MQQLTQLGSRSEIPASPIEAHIETIPNKHKAFYCVRFTCVEYSSLCPVTGAPDFAHIVIDYIPIDKLIEHKSLKLYLHSFREYRTFHEDCIAMIATRLWDELNPYWIRVVGFFFPRGGMPLDVYFCLGKIPNDGIHVPSVDRDFKGRF